MSFYLDLSSTESLDVHPENSGGEFQVELPAPLHFEEDDPWEVALVEMTYDAQGFPNIPSKYSEIKIEALNRDTLFDLTEKDMSITGFIRNKGDWHESDSPAIEKKKIFKTGFA